MGIVLSYLWIGGFLVLGYWGYQWGTGGKYHWGYELTMGILGVFLWLPFVVWFVYEVMKDYDVSPKGSE